ncbi:MAG: type II CAAX prenyl endopeptidase Rce1 family protein [Phycisphaerae bacterium]
MASRQSSWKFSDVLSPQGRGYFHRTQRPLHCLVFVLPWLIVFEAGMVWRRHAEPGRLLPSLVASKVIERFVELLGASGIFFPGLLLVAILLGWHLVARHPWTIDKPTLAGMLGESVIWAVPLYVFNSVLQQARQDTLEARWIDDVILSIGAGIYEELVFRLIAITLLSLILIDVFSLNRNATIVFIFFASAALFAAHHHEPFGSEPFDTVKFLFRTGAGLYLTGIFVFRGFGIAAGAHAVYDILVVTVAAMRSAGPLMS